VRLTRELIGERMFPVTMAGLDRAIDELRRPLSRAARAVPGLARPPATEPTEAPYR
jgi:hypothetical protein